MLSFVQIINLSDTQQMKVRFYWKSVFLRKHWWLVKPHVYECLLCRCRVSLEWFYTCTTLRSYSIPRLLECTLGCLNWSYTIGNTYCWFHLLVGLLILCEYTINLLHYLNEKIKLQKLNKTLSREVAYSLHLHSASVFSGQSVPIPRHTQTHIKNAGLVTLET